MILLIKLLLLIITAVLIGYPLFSKNSNQIAKREDDEYLPHLLFKKEMIYTTIKEIDFDLKAGKMSQDDYQELRQQYEKEAMNILGEIDRYKKSGKKTKEAEDIKPQFCTSCGKVHKDGDRFCNNCGKAIPV